MTNDTFEVVSLAQIDLDTLDEIIGGAVRTI